MAAPAALVRLRDLHDRRPLAFWATIAVGAGVVLAVGALVAPGLVVEQFLWKNFWGPTAADANQTGAATRFGIRVTEDYTLTSELVYGLILAGALYSIYHHLFRKAGVVCDGRFILALTPYVLFGPVGRVLEDANVFCRAATDCDPTWFAYPFISPLIYIFDAAIVVAHMLVLRRALGLDLRGRRTVVGATLGLQFALYGFIVTAWRGEFTHVLRPAYLLPIMLAAYGLYELGERRGYDRFRTGLFALGLPIVLGPLAMIGQWILGDPWSEAPRGLHSGILPWSVGLALGVTAAVWLVGRALRNDAPRIASLALPLNLGLVFGHMLDGFATFLAICSDIAGRVCSGASGFGLGLSGYGEKHPVSEFFLTFGDGWGFPAMKLAMVLLIVYLIDSSAKDGKTEDRTLIGLVKMAVLVLGLAPGTRDVLRVAMGV